MAKDLENLVFTINIEGGQQARAMLEKIADSFDKVGDEAQKTDKQTQQVSAAMLSFASFAGNLAANAVSFLVRELTQLGIAFGQSVIAEAAEGEQSIIALEAAIKNAGLEMTTTKEALDGLTDSLVKTTTFTDDEIMAAETLAIRLGWTTDELSKYMQTAADLAQSRGVSLSDTVLALNKSLAGNATALQRIYPEIKDFTEAELKAGAAIDYINKAFGGASAAALNTYAGQVGQLSKAWDDLKEALGAPIIRELRPFIESITASIREFISTDQFRDFANGIAENIGIAAAWIGEFILFLQGKPNALTGMYNLDRGGTLFDRLLGGLRLSLEKLTEEMISLVSEPTMQEKIGEVGFKIASAIIGGIGKGVANLWGGVDWRFLFGLDLEARPVKTLNFAWPSSPIGSGSSLSAPQTAPTQSANPGLNMINDIKIYSNGETTAALDRNLRQTLSRYSNNVLA